jgi:hypothetical protein
VNGPNVMVAVFEMTDGSAAVAEVGPNTCRAYPVAAYSVTAAMVRFVSVGAAVSRAIHTLPVAGDCVLRKMASSACTLPYWLILLVGTGHSFTKLVSKSSRSTEVMRGLPCRSVHSTSTRPRSSS